jgi:hypothetical protein
MTAAALACVLLFSHLSPGRVIQSLSHEDLPLFQDFTAHFLPTAGSFLSRGLPAQGYYYSAFFAMIISPLSSLSMPSAVTIWFILQCLLMLLLIAVPWRRFTCRKPWYFMLYVFLTITSAPVLESFLWGQVSTLMTLMVIASLVCYERGRLALSALMLGIITSIKFYPALFLLMFLCRNDRRAATLFVLFTVALLFLPALVLTPGGLIRFEREGVGSVLWSPWIAEQSDSMYFPHLLHRLLPIPGTGILMTLLSIGSLAVPVWMVLTLNRSRKRAGSIDPTLMVCCLFLCLPFILKSSWMHYFTFLPFCQVTALARLSGGAGAGRPSGMIRVHIPLVLSMVISSVFVLAVCGGWEVYGRFGFLLIADLLVLATLLLGTPWQPFGATNARTEQDRAGRG